MPSNASSNTAAERFLASLGRLPPLAPGTALGIAVSGGPDSLALAHLACLNLPQVKVSLAVVDHGLRKDSAQEAQAVSERLRGFCRDVTVLTWSPPAPVASRKLEQARNARFALLSQWAETRGILRVWLGHHADDQDETRLMRGQRGSGERGLSGMAARRVMAQTIFERPLLDWRKAALLAYCRDKRLAFVSDPSNEDRRTARGALRAQGVPPLSPAVRDRAQDQDQDLDTAGAAADPLGHLWFRRGRLTPLALQQALGWVRGGYYSPEQARVEQALEALAASPRVSVFGCVVEQRAGGWTLVCRETRQRRLAAPKQDEMGLWRLDDRWQVDGPEGDWSLVGSRDLRPSRDVPARALSCLPVWNDRLPEIRGDRLFWPDNAARFSPRRPVFDPREL